MTTNEIALRGDATPALRSGPLDYPTILKLGEAFAASGLFADVKDAGTAAVKIMAGAEMGLEPVAAMNGIDIIPGRQGRGPRMRPNADVQALLAARAGFTYQPVQHDDTHCVLRWFKDGEPYMVPTTDGGKVQATSEFTAAQARKAGLVRDGGAWNAWGMNMVLARAVTQGVKLYCRHILAGQIGGMPIVTTEELDTEYPDPRDDLVRALHATYREVYPQDGSHSEDEYRQERLDWSEYVLGRDVPSWNGPGHEETLTRAEFQMLLDTAANEAGTVLHNRLHAAFGDDEIAGLNFLHRVLPGVPFEALSDLTGQQRKAVHKALDALQDTQPAPSGQAAPVSPHAAGADLSEGSAGTDSDEPGDVTNRSESPAEHHTAEGLEGVPPADGTEPGGPSRSDTGPPPGPAPATRRPKTPKPGKPNIPEAQAKAEAVRKQTTTEASLTPIQALPPTFRKLLVAHFNDSVPDAEAAIGTHIATWSQAGTWPASGPDAPWNLALLQELAAATFEKELYPR